jgi:multidrug efflux system membrane fusion protein
MKHQLFILLSSLSLILVACSHPEPPKASDKIVMVAHPTGSASTINSYAGEVKARQESALSFRVGGKISQRLVDVGDQVQAGQVLATLDATDANLQVNAAKAQLDSALSAEKTAKTELGRYQQLVGSNAISRSQFDQIDNQYKNAKSALQQAQANYDVVNNQSSYSVLRADKNGVIVARNIEIGQVVAAGQAAYSLAIAGDREVLIGVPEQLISQFKVNQSVQVSLWSKPNALLPAYVREIAAATDTSRTFAVRVAFRDRSAPVSIGQSARVFTAQPAQTGQLSLPLSAITAEGQQSYVWVVNPKTSQLQKIVVTIGTYGRDSVPVLSGLNSADWVVLAGVHLLREGQKVRSINRENQPVDLSQPAHLKPTVTPRG